MKSTRNLAKLSLLLVIVAALGAYLSFDRWSPAVSLWWEMRQDPPLPGENHIGNIRLAKKSDDVWTVTFDYYFIGYPKPAQVALTAGVSVRKGGSILPRPFFVVRPAQRGQHSVTIDVADLGSGNYAASAESFTVVLEGANRRPDPAAPTATLTQHVEWTDPGTIAARPENVLRRAVALIDSEQPHSLGEARVMLQGLVARAPAFDPAYVELARVAMKTRGLEGMTEAESLIQSALQIRPDSVDARLLLAYVYAHQQRYADARAINEELERQGTANLWLGTNFGELEQLQGHDDAAIAKYREVLAHPPTADKYDRARLWTYEVLLQMLWTRKDLDGVEALYRQRVADYPQASCAAAHLAQFLVLQRGDADGALATLRAAPDGGCGEELGRQVMGLAHYTKWANGAEEQRAEALRQARVFLPAGPELFYQLASADATAAVARKLVAAGENVNAQDAEHLDALTYALRNRDHAIAARLLRLGARTDTLVGDEKIPVSLLPVLMQDVEGVVLLRRSGVDYSRVRYQGLTAAEIARRAENVPLQRALDPKGDQRGSGRA